MGCDPEKKQQVRIEVVDASGDGQRIDNFLLKHLKGVPKSHLYKLMRKGQLRVNGKRVKPNQKLELDDRVRIPPLRTAENEGVRIPPRLLALFADLILYESTQLIIIDKPAGFSVHRGSGVDYGIIDIYKALREDAAQWSLVHRLDRDTSGCLIIAKDRPSLLAAQDLFRHGGVAKEYLALTAGLWPEETRLVDLPLRKNVLQGGERMVVVADDGKSARSHFDVVEHYRDASLMRVSIETGRTHQIRVHSQRSGHAVAGDSRYGDKEFNRRMRKLGLKRMFLHAHRLRFALDEPVDVVSPLPEELAQFLAILKSKAGKS